MDRPVGDATTDPEPQSTEEPAVDPPDPLLFIQVVVGEIDDRAGEIRRFTADFDDSDLGVSSRRSKIGRRS